MAAQGWKKLECEMELMWIGGDPSSVALARGSDAAGRSGAKLIAAKFIAQ